MTRRRMVGTRGRPAPPPPPPPDGTFVEGSDAPLALPYMSMLYGGLDSGSWLTTKLPDNRAINTAGTPPAVAELQRQRTNYAPWINGMFDTRFTSIINVVPADQPMVHVDVINAAHPEWTAVGANGLPIPDNGVTLPASGDSDAELVFIQPGWSRTDAAGFTWQGRMYEMWVAWKDPSTGWGCVGGGRMVGLLNKIEGHWYDWFWGQVDDGNVWGPDGLGTWKTWGAQATSIPLTNTIISRYDLKQGIIRHPVHFMLNSVTGILPAGGFVWPAQRNDSSSSDVLPQGSMLRLPPSTVINPAWPWLTRLIATAARDYGLVFTDTAAGLTFRIEPGGARYVEAQDGIVDPGLIINPFPWGSLQLMVPGSDANHNPTA